MLALTAACRRGPGLARGAHRSGGGAADRVTRHGFTAASRTTRVSNCPKSPTRVGVFVAHDPERREQLQQLVRIEHDGAADRPRLRRVAMEPFDDDHAAGPQRLHDLRGVFAPTDVAQHDEVPAPVPQSKSSARATWRRDLHAELRRLFLRRRHRAVCGIEADGVPSLLREVDRVAPLPHADVERASRLQALGHGDEKGVRRRVEPRLR